MKYEAHEIADSFAQLSDEEYQALVTNIHEEGLKTPMWLYEGKILDGRHRYNAILDLLDRGIRIEPRFEVFEGTYEEAIRHAESLNVYRRHEVYAQKVCHASRYVEENNQGHGGDRRSEGFQVSNLKLETNIYQRAASKYGVAVGNVNSAVKILHSEPDLFEYMETQEPCPENKFKPLSLRDAQKIAATRRKEREASAAGTTDSAIDEEVEETEEEVEEGRWWQLGRHRLYCGDSGSPAFYEGLPSVPFAFADPPYNAEVAAWDKDFQWRHDWLIRKAETVAVTPGIASIFHFARTTKMPYVWSLAFYINNGMTRGALGFGNWIYAALFSEGSVFRNAQDFAEVSISNKAKEETEHKGRKPSAVLIWLLNRFTKEGETVIDPFLGSGTTLFAAETTGRVCIGAEKNPFYCQEIILRWQRMTKEKAILLNADTL